MICGHQKPKRVFTLSSRIASPQIWLGFCSLLRFFFCRGPTCRCQSKNHTEARLPSQSPHNKIFQNDKKLTVPAAIPIDVLVRQLIARVPPTNLCPLPSLPFQPCHLPERFQHHRTSEVQPTTLSSHWIWFTNYRFHTTKEDEALDGVIFDPCSPFNFRFYPFASIMCLVVPHSAQCGTQNDVGVLIGIPTGQTHSWAKAANEFVNCQCSYFRCMSLHPLFTQFNNVGSRRQRHCSLNDVILLTLGDKNDIWTVLWLPFSFSASSPWCCRGQKLPVAKWSPSYFRRNLSF